MLTFSIVWVMLAAAITVLAMRSKSAPARDGVRAAAANRSERSLLIFGALYALILLTGFFCVGSFLVSSL